MNAPESLNLPKWDSALKMMRPIAHLLDEDRRLTDILVRRHNRVFVRPFDKDDPNCGLQPGVGWDSNDHFEAFLRAVAAALSQPIDPFYSPRIDGVMPSGARIGATLSPYAQDGHECAIRLFPKVHYSGDDMVRFGAVTGDVIDYLRGAARDRRTMIFSGAVGSGKSTMLRVVAGEIPRYVSVAVAEDSSELRLGNHHLVSWEVPPRNFQGEDKPRELTLSDTIDWARREMTEQLIVGEIRKPVVAWSFLQSMMIGARGSMTTLHADNAIQAIENLALWASLHLGIGIYHQIREFAFNLVDIVVHMENVDGVRKVVEIYDSNPDSFSRLSRVPHGIALTPARSLA